MGWEDRDWAQEDNPLRRFGRPGGDFQGMRPSLDNPLTWSLRLGRVAGITVRVHVVFLIVVVVLLLQAATLEAGSLGPGPIGLLLSCLFVVVLLHEFGHCIACRLTGGAADEILMWPLGGLAFCQPPLAWRAHLITAAGGPAVNVLIFAVLAPVLYALTGSWWGVAIPRLFGLTVPAAVWDSWLLLGLFLANAVSLILLLFNLLPIFPLDGGRLLQAVLWPRFGYTRSMRYAVRSGYFGAIALGIFGFVIGSVMLVLIALFGGWTCWVTSRQVQFTDEFMGFEAPHSAVAAGDDGHKPPGRRRRRAERRAERELAESRRVEAILEKISRSGMESLSRGERRELRRATRRSRGKHQGTEEQRD